MENLKEVGQISKMYFKRQSRSNIFVHIIILLFFNVTLFNRFKTSHDLMDQLSAYRMNTGWIIFYIGLESLRATTDNNDISMTLRSLPINQDSLVGGKYLFTAVYMLVFALVNIFFSRNIYMTLVLISKPLVFISLIYIAYYLFGKKVANVLIIIIFGLSNITSMNASKEEIVSFMFSNKGSVILFIISILIFIASYFINIRIRDEEII